MPTMVSPSYAEVRALLKTYFPHESITPEWLLLIDKAANGGIYYSKDGVRTAVSPVPPVVLALAVATSVVTGAPLDLRGAAAQLHLGSTDSVDGAYVLGLPGQAWFSAGLHYDGVNWVADQTGVGMVFGMFVGGLSFYTSVPTTVGATATLVLQASFGAAGMVLSVVGAGIFIKEGANATLGVATLVAGTVTVNTTKVTANSRIMLTAQNAGSGATTWGALGVSARTAGTSFTVTSSLATDTRQVAWQILEPAA